MVLRVNFKYIMKPRKLRPPRATSRAHSEEIGFDLVQLSVLSTESSSCRFVQGIPDNDLVPPLFFGLVKCAVRSAQQSYRRRAMVGKS